MIPHIPVSARKPLMSYMYLHPYLPRVALFTIGMDHDGIYSCWAGAASGLITALHWQVCVKDDQYLSRVALPALVEPPSRRNSLETATLR